MQTNQDKIDELILRLNQLQQQHTKFGAEIQRIESEFKALIANHSELEEAPKPVEEIKPEPVEIKPVVTESVPVETVQTDSTPTEPIKEPEVTAENHKNTPPPKLKLNLEAFIGENLINKIGIGITVLGVGIGSKYAIEHDMVSPLTRIILGYLVGLGLLGVAFRLKSKYEQYSAVLLSGAMAIMYFVTFAAYSFYDLFPQMVAFSLMVIFTVFTVLAALNYNNQIIALIGMVGAYAVPFLLSNNSGNVKALFIYMTVINVGILFIAFKKYWRLLYYIAFGFTWLVFLAWFTDRYSNDHLAISLTFASIFYVIFYIQFIAYRFFQKEKLEATDVVILLFNSFIYYGVGYYSLSSDEVGKELLGVFTLVNAVIHFVVSYFLYKGKQTDEVSQKLITGLVLVFLTATIPVQLDGKWVTVLWATEGCLLFWLGRSKQVKLFELLSFGVLVLAFLSLVEDWFSVYRVYNVELPETRVTPFFNTGFLTSVIFIISIGLMNFINLKTNRITEDKPTFSYSLLAYVLPSILIFTLYNSIRLEIDNYWYQLYKDSRITKPITESSYAGYYFNVDINHFKNVWLILYSLIFASGLIWINIKWVKNELLGRASIILSLMILLVFTIGGLYELSELRTNYINQYQADIYNITSFNLTIRYISLLVAAVALLSTYRAILTYKLVKKYDIILRLSLHVFMLWILSSELIHWMDISGNNQSYKLGLSILWGIYSVWMITTGIWKKKQYLRFGAIALFGVTLLKLFFYDISHLNTISKTIVLVALGILLLIISFLYNKYKSIITDDESE